MEIEILHFVEGAKKAKITGFRITPTCITYTDDDIYVLPAIEVKNDPESYDRILDDEVMERINAASDNLIPWMLNDTDYTGEFIGNTYIVNF